MFVYYIKNLSKCLISRDISKSDYFCTDQHYLRTSKITIILIKDTQQRRLFYDECKKIDQRVYTM